MSETDGRTEHGFRLGAIEATALADWGRGSAAVGIKVGRTEFDIQASPKGQKVSIVMPEKADSYLRIVAPNGDEVTLRWSKRWGGYVVLYRNGRYLKSMDFNAPELTP